LKVSRTSPLDTPIADIGADIDLRRCGPRAGMATQKLSLQSEKTTGCLCGVQPVNWLERDWMRKDSSKSARPSKEDLRKEAHQIGSEQAQVNDDFQGLMRAQ